VGNRMSNRVGNRVDNRVDNRVGTFGGVCAATTRTLCVCIALLCGSAVQAQQPRTTIVINDEVIGGGAQPIARGGVTFVPLRTVFDALGITLVWNEQTKTIRGIGATGTMQLQLGSTRASVNGNDVVLLEPPFARRGNTYVPLRFVAEAIDAQVQYDRDAQRITIVNQYKVAPARIDTAKEKQAIKNSYDRMITVSNEERIQELMNTVHPFSPIRNWILTAQTQSFALRDVKTQVVSFLVETLDALTASVRVREQHTWRGGAFFVDHESEVVVTMRKHPQLGWLIFDAVPQQTRWLRTDRAWPVAIEVPESLKAQVQAFMQGIVLAANKKKFDEWEKNIDAQAPFRDAMIDAMRHLLDAYDLIHELEEVRIVGQTAQQLYVYTVQTMRKVSGPAFADVRVQSVHTIAKQPNGTLKFVGTFHGPKTEL
jgi:hypothetical protein